jgi:electron transfer flavoprotein beta subunit
VGPDDQTRHEEEKMKIVVALRLVPDLSEDIEFNEEGTGLDTEWIDIKLNEFDDYALEEATLLGEANEAEVIALTPDVEGADRLLRTALARGAHKGIKLSVGPESKMDARVLAPLFASAAKDLGADLVLTGVQSPDDLFGPLTGYLGASLDWPFAGAIAGTRIGNGAIVALQEYSGGHSAELELQLPAVLGIQAPSKPMRYVSGTKMREMMSAEFESIAASSQPGKTSADIEEMSEPTRQGQAKMLSGDGEAVAAAIAKILKERGLTAS